MTLILRIELRILSFGIRDGVKKAWKANWAKMYEDVADAQPEYIVTLLTAFMTLADAGMIQFAEEIIPSLGISSDGYDLSQVGILACDGDADEDDSTVQEEGCAH